MTQSEGNGNKSDADIEGMATYEPAYTSEDDTDPAGWWEEEPGKEEGRFISKLPPELNPESDREPPATN